MTESLISVIVPVYNAERWIKKCIFSILRQTYHNIEIILVDDGSKDKSLTICKNFAKTDTRIRIISKENGGVSSARNAGLLSAKGEYITFVDSDDFLASNAIGVMAKVIEQSKADFCVGQIIYLSPVGNVHQNRVKNRVCKRIDMSEFCDFLDGMDTGPCGKLFKRSVIKQNNIMFDESVHMGEDTIFFYDYLRACNVIASVDGDVYYINGLMETSLSRNTYHENLAENLHRCLYKYIEIFRGEKNTFTELSIEKNIIRFFKISCGHYIACLRDQPELSLKKIQEASDIYNNDLKRISNKNINENDKIFVEKILQITTCNDVDKFFEETKFKSIKKYILKCMANMRICFIWGISAII